MNNSSNYNNVEPKEPKEHNVSCKYGCQRKIGFDKDKKGPKGNLIPLNLDGSIHNCPNRKNNSNISQNSSSQKTTATSALSRTIPCHYCQGKIGFDDNITAKTSGKKIPLNPDRTFHDCEKNPYNRAKITTTTTAKQKVV